MAELKIDKEWVKDAVQPIIDRIKAEYIHKSVIEDIKTEISEYKDDKVIHAERNEMIDIVLDIIDKHCGKEHE